MTPDEEGPSRIFPGTASAVSTPPTPFADRQSLEAELQALERDLGGLSKTSWDEGAVYGAVRYGASSSSGAGNTASWEGEDDEETSLNSLTMPDLVDSREPGGPSLAALRHLKSDDIDMFIANMAVPPPPSVVRQQQQVQQKHSPVVELTSEELSAFIIPPPPATAGHRGGGGDREVLELRVAAHQKVAPPASDSNALSPKIASLQERLAQLSSIDGQARPGKEMSLTLTKDRYGYPVQGKREGSSPQQAATQAPTRQETADRSNVLRGQVQTKRDIFMRQGSSPELAKNRPEESPPPPRTAVPKHFSSSTLGRKPAPTYQFGANMTR